MDGYVREKVGQIKLISYGVNLLASLVTITVGILNMDTFALAAIGFLVWAISPYLFAAFITKRSTQYAVALVITGVSFILAIGGIFLLIDAMYIHMDAQSALVFVVIPMYQWIILLITAISIYFINKNRA